MVYSKCADCHDALKNEPKGCSNVKYFLDYKHTACQEQLFLWANITKYFENNQFMKI